MNPLRHRRLAAIRVCPTVTLTQQQDRAAIVRKIADAVGAAERKFQRAVGADWEAAYRADWAVADETCGMLHEPARAAVLPRFRMIGHFDGAADGAMPDRQAAAWDHARDLRKNWEPV